jgi:hypothetical protein
MLPNFLFQPAKTRKTRKTFCDFWGVFDFLVFAAVPGLLQFGGTWLLELLWIPWFWYLALSQGSPLPRSPGFATV